MDGDFGIPGVEQSVVVPSLPQPAQPQGNFMPDTGKLFVGQLPRSYTENDVRDMLAAFGSVTDVKVITDRATGASRGCAFARFATVAEAEQAIQALHAKTVLPGMSNPVQIKFAESKEGGAGGYGAQAGRPVGSGAGARPGGGYPGAGGPPGGPKDSVRLYVAGLPYSIEDDGLKQLFETYGVVVDVKVLRHSDTNRSKGCGFVRMATMPQAKSAIDNLNNTSPFPEQGSRFLEVKFAEDNAQKAERAAGRGGMGGAGAVGAYGAYPGAAAAGMAGWGAAAGAYGAYPGMYPGYMGWGYPGMMPGYPGVPGAAAPAAPGYPGAYPGYPPAAPGGYPAAAAAGYGAHAAGGYGDSSRGAAGGARAPRQQEGPPGANLFVQHFADGTTDGDLARMFSSFGPVLSAKVFVDKATGKARDFGFVSFADPSSAKAAVDGMNGAMQAGGKKLKVGIKNGGGAGAAAGGGY